MQKINIPAGKVLRALAGNYTFTGPMLLNVWRGLRLPDTYVDGTPIEVKESAVRNSTHKISHKVEVKEVEEVKETKKEVEEVKKVEEESEKTEVKPDTKKRKPRKKAKKEVEETTEKED